MVFENTIILFSYYIELVCLFLNVEICEYLINNYLLQ